MPSHFKERTNLRTFLTSLALFFVGVILLVISEVSTFIGGTAWLKAIVSNFGGLLVATISLALIWELVSKRAFLDELLEKAGFAEDIRQVGLVGISTEPLRGPDFSKLIRNTKTLDIYVCYANTWRANFENDLRALAQKPNAHIRLFVPNPENAEIMKELAHRFCAADSTVVANKIREAIKEFKAIFTTNAAQIDFSIWVHEENPVTSFYRFDGIAVVTLYKHARGRGNAPTFIVEIGGTFYRYVEAEVLGMIKGTSEHPTPLARKIFPT